MISLPEAGLIDIDLYSRGDTLYLSDAWGLGPVPLEYADGHEHDLVYSY